MRGLTNRLNKPPIQEKPFSPKPRRNKNTVGHERLIISKPVRPTKIFNFQFSIFNSKTAKRLIQEKPFSIKTRRNKNTVGHERLITNKPICSTAIIHYSLFTIHYSFLLSRIS